MNVLRSFQRLGLLWQLLLPSMAATILCVVAVQSWTLRVSQAALEQRMELNLDTSISLLKVYLSRVGDGWTVDNGRLRLGGVDLSTRNGVVDEAARVSKGVATIFLGDLRVATNIMKPDGTPAVGTRLTDETIRSAVLKDGRTFRGSTTILGNRYLTIYEPIRDLAGSVIGIVFVGLPAAELDMVEANVIWQGIEAGGVTLLLLALANAWFLTRTLRPLDALAATMRRLATGTLNVDIANQARQDQIGRMALALQTFKDAALSKKVLEAEAAAGQAALEAARRDMDAQKSDADRRKVSPANREVSLAAKDVAMTNVATIRRSASSNSSGSSSQGFNRRSSATGTKAATPTRSVNPSRP